MSQLWVSLCSLHPSRTLDLPTLRVSWFFPSSLSLQLFHFECIVKYSLDKREPIALWRIRSFLIHAIRTVGEILPEKGMQAHVNSLPTLLCDWFVYCLLLHQYLKFSLGSVSAQNFPQCKRSRSYCKVVSFLVDIIFLKGQYLDVNYLEKARLWQLVLKGWLSDWGEWVCICIFCMKDCRPKVYASKFVQDIQQVCLDKKFLRFCTGCSCVHW